MKTMSLLQIQILLGQFLCYISAVYTSDNQCSLQNGLCTYNVFLSNNDGGCGATRETVKNGIHKVLNEQNDVVKMNQMQQDFNSIKTDHEVRLKELETSMQKMLRSAVPNGRTHVVYNSGPAPLNLQMETTQNNNSETGLLSRLQKEFSKLRSRLREKGTQLLKMTAQLNETTKALTDSQNDLFETSKNLIIQENKATSLQQERYILKNQVKYKTEKLEAAEEKMNYTDRRLMELEEQLYKLVRSESNLKEELGFYKLKLNGTINTMKELQRNHTLLKGKHTKTKQELRKAEIDLLECITAKTQSFCGFEDNDICGFKQNTEDDFDWSRRVGRTPSSGTGPATDHTCKASRAGRYMYIEASAKGRNQKAVLTSPKYYGIDELCVGFYYHMFGRQIGTLNVYTKTENDQEINTAWRTFGNQGNVWIKALLSIPKALARAGFQLVFEGITHNGYQGDMAIDDVTVKDGSCTDDNIKPVVVTTNITGTEVAAVRRLRRYRKFKQQQRRQKANNPK